MTTEPNALTVSINHERMPVLLSDPADFDTWLSGSTQEAFKLAQLRGRPDALRAVGVGAQGLAGGMNSGRFIGHENARAP